jgi:hypothetical protein
MPTPKSCYVCGGAPHGNTFTETGKGHNYWSVADAEAEFAAADAGRTFAYSSGATTAESQYVATYRPY